jgi:hypothetical protein
MITLPQLKIGQGTMGIIDDVRIYNRVLSDEEKNSVIK